MMGARFKGLNEFRRLSTAFSLSLSQGGRKMISEKWRARLRIGAKWILYGAVAIYAWAILYDLNSMTSDISSIQSDISSIQSDISSIESEMPSR